MAREKRKRTDAREWAKQQEKGYEPTAIKLPDGIAFYKLEVGTHTVDFMPYIVGKGNPRADVGFEHFEREYGTHRVPMPNGRDSVFCCLWKCFKKPCPVCKWTNEKGGTADKDLINKLREKTYHLWLINDKPGDKKNPLKVFVSNHYNRGSGFGEMMADAFSSSEEYANFTDLENGLSVKLTVKEQTWPGGKFNAVTRIDFVPRKHTYPESVLDNAPCLDEMLIEMSFKELEKILNQGGNEEEETPDETLEENEDQEETSNDEVSDSEKTAKECGIKLNMTVEYKDKEYEVTHISGDGTSLRLTDNKGKEIRGIAPEDCTVVPDDDETEEPEDKPTAKKKVSAKKPDPIEEDNDPDDSEIDPSDLDSDLDLDDEEPKKKTTAKPAAKKPAAKKQEVDEDEDIDGSDLDSELEESSDLDSDLEEDEEPEPPAPKKKSSKK